MSKSCLNCGNWTSKARGNAAGEHWCREMNTWTAPGFACQAHADMPMQDGPGEWYTVGEVAAQCFVHRTTVIYWITTGRLKAYPIADNSVKLAGQFSTRWRIDKANADRYIAWYLSVTGSD